jgi:hypothetical protein
MNPSAKALIENLSSADFSARQSAAGDIFRLGRTPADSILAEWLGDKEFSALFGDKPQATVGIAVPRESFTKIRAANGMPPLASVPSDQDAEEFELEFPGLILLDILTSRAPGGDGAIAKFLERFGEGVQQVEYRCEDVDRATKLLKERFNVAAVYPASRAGANGTRVNFFLLSSASRKVLIELYEAAATH